MPAMISGANATANPTARGKLRRADAGREAEVRKAYQARAPGLQESDNLA